MSEQGWILDDFSLEILETNDQQVSFCGERPLDLNFDGFGGAWKLRGGAFRPLRGGGKLRRVREWVREAPGQAYKS